MATHSSILAWKIPWTEEPGRLQSMGHKESDTAEQQGTHAHKFPGSWKSHIEFGHPDVMNQLLYWKNWTGALSWDLGPQCSLWCPQLSIASQDKDAGVVWLCWADLLARSPRRQDEPEPSMLSTDRQEHSGRRLYRHRREERRMPGGAEHPLRAPPFLSSHLERRWN